MSHNLSKGKSIPKSLLESSVNLDFTFKQAIERIYKRYESEPYLCILIGREQGIFDDIYINIVKGGEKEGNLKHSFELLARP